MHAHRYMPALFITGLLSLCLPQAAVYARDVPGFSTVGLTPGISDAVDAETLDRIVWPIVTVVERTDGSHSLRIGSGFVVGRNFYTVAHNIGTSSVGSDVHRTILIGGVAVSPVYSDFEHDVAVFILPDELCTRMCNQLRFGPMPALERERPVFWLRKFQGEQVYKQGAVTSYAILGDTGAASPGAWSCNYNLVVEIDEPFVSGTSGSPVVHAGTGRIVGIVQGSFESDGVQTGYFKPVDCVRHLTGKLASGWPGPGASTRTPR